MALDVISSELALAIRDEAQPLTGASGDYDALLEEIGDARFVLVGEGSHGTHEFYRERAQLTKRLIREKGFTAVAVEADWPDAYRINRYVRGIKQGDAIESLVGFQRFPTWMWRNADVLDFMGWLRSHNDALPPAERVGFYGMDLYSLYTSIDEVIRYLDDVDPRMAEAARRRYACFDHFREDPHEYGHVASSGFSSCERFVVEQWMALSQRAGELAVRDGREASDAFFDAEQNARLAKNAEAYYRTMFEGEIDSWNLRDRHMAETVEQLATHLEQGGLGAKIVIWAHNSHLGDARATEMGWHGELNVGQLLRERYGRDAFLVGFTTYEGTVTAASHWGGDAERMRVRPALEGSYEELFHHVGLPRFFLPLRNLGEGAAGLTEQRLERAIGVIYRPRSERYSHYFEARLPQQFDAILHFDVTRAVEPLERTPGWLTAEAPETFPSGM